MPSPPKDTEGAASTNSALFRLSVIEEVVSDILRLATRGGAAAAPLADEAGHIAQQVETLIARHLDDDSNRTAQQLAVRLTRLNHILDDLESLNQRDGSPKVA